MSASRMGCSGSYPEFIGPRENCARDHRKPSHRRRPARVSDERILGVENLDAIGPVQAIHGFDGLLPGQGPGSKRLCRPRA